MKSSPLIFLASTFFLSACGTAPLPTAAAPTESPVPTPSATSTPVPPSPTLLPTKTSVSMQTKTPLPLVSLKGLRVAYFTAGQIYVQDSGSQPVLLSHRGEVSSTGHPILMSDDGRKVVHYNGANGRDSANYRVYAINTDGSGYRTLVTGDLLTAFHPGYDINSEIYGLAFVPGTHKLLFNTSEFDPLADPTDLEHGYAQPNHDLLLADTDTGNIKQILQPGKGGIFMVSPNGKLVAVLTADHIDVLDINGQIIHSDLVTYPQIWKYNRVQLSWSADSQSLIVLLPINSSSDDTDGPEPLSLWKYPMDGQLADEIRLTPAPMGSSFEVSPDGNWIVYTYFFYEGKTDPNGQFGVYLGNLRDGTSRLLLGEGTHGSPQFFSWSPDSQHFLAEGTELFLGDIQSNMVPIGGGSVLGWVDASHYLMGHGAIMGDIDQEARFRTIQFPDSYLSEQYNRTLTYVFLKP
jgi:hypothetical protein